VRSPLLPTLARLIGPSLVVALVRSCRVKICGGEHLAALRASGKPFLYALWHGRMLTPIVLHRHQGVAAMVSLHGDGEVVAQILRRLGYETVRGSSTRGGKEAFKLMVQWLETGGVGAVIPDGPKGPAREAKSGVVRIAIAAGVPILPLGCAARPAKVFASWDAFALPLPLARVNVAYEQPLLPTGGASDEAVESLRLELTRRLDRAQEQAEAACALAGGRRG